jgi:hypothetical protein
MLSKNMKIDFAYRTFPWASEARGKAIVHVVIVGFSAVGSPRPVIYDRPVGKSEPIMEVVTRINPYLLDAPDILVESQTTPISPSLHSVQYGNKPSDGGFLMVETPEDVPPEGDAAWKYIRPLLGAQELLHAEERWCIWMEAPDPAAVHASAWLRNRLASVKKFREYSTASDTRNMASRPWRFFRIPQPTVPYLAIPTTVSENRQWFIVAYEPPDVIASNALFTVADPDGFLFAILSSAMFTAWLSTIGGRLKSDFRFSGPMVYNTFPLPLLPEAQRNRIIEASKRLLAARENHAGIALADLYNPLAMHSDILNAHKSLDLAVDRAFTARGRPSTVTDRMRILFPAYQRMRLGN